MSTARSEALEPLAGDVGAGHVLGRYELLMPIASGGMAMVWAARLKGTRGFQKIVAVKTMLPKLSEDDHFEQMFLDEASLASRIRHPHVVEILDLGEQENVLFLVMEWIDGVPLNELMKIARKNGGVPLPVAVRIVMQACAGLHAAHELKDDKGQLVGLVHRDVSPQNILVSGDGVAKVVDFGVAKATAVGGGATAAGQLKGKAAYMAPEQIKGASIDRRVDVFAMGVVLYALTTGKHPFRKESEAATLYRIVSPEPALPPRRLFPGYPAALERVVVQALAKDPSKRYPTANDLLRALDQSLPASMRVSTDEDVAAFVRGLFGEKLEQRRLQLQRAIETAEQRAQSRQGSLRELLDSQPPPPPHSQVTPSAADHSVPSAVLARISDSSLSELAPLSQTSPTLSSANAAAVLANVEPPKRSRAGAVLAFLLLLALIGVAAVALYLRQARPVADAPPPGIPAAARAPESTIAETPEPKPLADEPPAASASPAPSSEPAEPAPTAQKASAPRSYKPAPAPSAKPAATSKPKATWKHDPGF